MTGDLQQKRSFKGIAQLLALSSATVLLVLFVLEVGLRAAGFESRHVHSISQKDYERVPGMYEPGTDAVSMKVRGLPHRVRINSLGFRGPEVDSSSAKPRVLCIGDSFTYGDSVGEAETLPARLSARFGERVEVLNGGVAGSTIVDQKVFLGRMLELEPQVVLLMYSENDLVDLRKDVPMHARLARNRELRGGVVGSAWRLVRDTAMFNLLLKGRAVVELYRAGGPETPTEATSPESGNRPGDIEELLARYTELVVEIRDLLAAKGIALVFAAYPWPEHVYADEASGSIPMLRDSLRRAGIDVVALRPALAASGLSLEELYLFPLDGHPAPAGYDLAAAHLAPRIEEVLVEAGSLQ